MTTDANELREAIAYLKAMLPEFAERGTHRIAAERVIAGAEAYADSLPREVDLEGWAVVGANGAVETIMRVKANADGYAACNPNWQVVRLTGKATLPPREKD